MPIDTVLKKAAWQLASTDLLETGIPREILELAALEPHPNVSLSVAQGFVGMPRVVE